jgi:hypothetical protein
MPADCPDLYCTVTSCQELDGCRQITHTFNRGPGQQPWVVPMPRQCPTRVKAVSFEELACDAYVVARDGRAVCLNDVGGSIKVSKVLTDSDRPIGLYVLKERPGNYVFSAKSKNAGLPPNVLYLPD